jgi:hypothetical protein
MSGLDYKSYSDRLEERSRAFSSDETTREKAYATRKSYLAKAKEEVTFKAAKPRVERDASDLYDPSMVRKKITCPANDVERIHIALIDNSGSNRIIADHLKKSSGYLMSVINTLDAKSQIAFMYCSDHGDGENFMQPVDYLFPDKEGDKALHSTLRNVSPANGFDPAEAFECALWEACHLNFGGAKHKHLYLVTDVVAHGMGLAGDDGCPFQRDWRDSVRKVYETFDSFEVVGCGSDAHVGHLQEQFLKPERVAYDLVDLSSIQESDHRARITGNALLFLIARHTGMQGIELFLSFLYEKWIEDPIFGGQTVSRAKEMIQRFGKYVEASEDEVKTLMDKILV